VDETKDQKDQKVDDTKDQKDQKPGQGKKGDTGLDSLRELIAQQQREIAQLRTESKEWRTKAKHAEAAAKGKVEEALQAALEKMKALEERIKAREAEDEKEWEALKEKLADNADLVPETLPALERVRLGRKLLEKLNTPSGGAGGKTPKGAPKDADGKFGGYGSLSEWATKDPKGYLEARRKGEI